MAELNWKIVNEAEAEMTPADCLSDFMCSWNDYTQGLRNSGPSRMYKYLDPRTIYHSYTFATGLLALPSIKKRERKRILLAVAQMKTAIENFRHIREIGSAKDDWSLPYWKYLSQYVHKYIQQYIENYAKEHNLDLLPKKNLD